MSDIDFGDSFPLVPAPLNYDGDKIHKQRENIRRAMEISLQNAEVRAALVWKMVNGKTLGDKKFDDLRCWDEFIKNAPDDAAAVINMGNFTTKDRVLMLNHVLRRFYQFDSDGKMTGELLRIESKPADAEKNAAAA